MSNRKPSTATQRLKQDYIRLKKDPVPYVVAEPLQSNILEWHYVVSGPEKTPYEGGVYHGKLIFPREFPFKPPSIYMITPNGRFKTNTRLCLSISDFHPDSWNPAWSVSTILTGLLSFMLETSPTLGSIETSEYEKKHLAWHSLAYNIRDPLFCESFPVLAQDIRQILERRKAAEEEVLSRGGSLTAENPTESNGTGRPRERQVSKTGAGGGLANGGERLLPPVPPPQPPAAHQSPVNSAVANICVLVAVAAFVYAVKYVVATTAAATAD